MCCANGEWCKIWLVSSKLTWRILQILTRALKNLKNLHFNGLLFTKVYNFELKKYRGVMFDGTEYWSKIWRKTDLRFQKWHEEFSKFSPEHVRKSKNWDFHWVFFIRSRKCMRLKFIGELCVMKMKNDAKTNWLVISKLTWQICRILT